MYLNARMGGSQPAIHEGICCVAYMSHVTFHECMAKCSMFLAGVLSDTVTNVVTLQNIKFFKFLDVRVNTIAGIVGCAHMRTIR